MKKYLSALALGGLLCTASIAYGVDQPVINQIDKPALNQPTIEIQNTDQVITKAEFYDMLTQLAGANNMLIGDGFLINEPIKYAEALNMCNIIANPFLIDQEEVASKDDTTLTQQDAETMLNDLATQLNLKQNEKNSQGISYALTPLEDGYKFELMWGKKPSSGYNIEIVDATTVGDILYVSYVTSEPKPGAAYLTVITYPSDSVVMETQQLPNKVVIINNN
jgi:hypothetical protein